MENRGKPLFKWTMVNALGLGVAFLAMLAPSFMELGINPDIPSPLTRNVLDMLATLVLYVCSGAILGAAQAVVLRSWNVGVVHWFAAAAAGFGANALIVAWPLQFMGLLGRIPGPVEPIIFTVGGCAMAGIAQCLLLRQRTVLAGRWLILWVVGLVTSIIPTFLMFFVLQGILELTLSWPVEAFLNGVMCAGFAALVSGNELFSSLKTTTE